MKVRLALTAIFIAYSVCFSEKPKSDVDCAEALKVYREAFYERDSIKSYTDSITEANKSLRKLISDNITIENMVKSQEFYNDAFDKILFSVSIFSGLFILLTAVSVFFNYKFDKYDKKLLALERKFKQDLEKQRSDLAQDIENQKVGLTQDIEGQKNHLKSEKNVIFKEIGTVYFSLAAAHHNQNTSKDWTLHFMYLSQYYDFLMANRIELTDKDLENLKRIDEFAEHYEKITMSIVDWPLWGQLQKYSHMLFKFIKYCKEKGYKEHLAEVVEANRKFNRIYDAINRNIPATNDPFSPNPSYPASPPPNSPTNPNKETPQ